MLRPCNLTDLTQRGLDSAYRIGAPIGLCLRHHPQDRMDSRQGLPILRVSGETRLTDKRHCCQVERLRQKARWMCIAAFVSNTLVRLWPDEVSAQICPDWAKLSNVQHCEPCCSTSSESQGSDINAVNLINVNGTLSIPGGAVKLDPNNVHHSPPADTRRKTLSQAPIPLVFEESSNAPSHRPIIVRNHQIISYPCRQLCPDPV